MIGKIVWLSIAESIRFATADCGRCCDRELFLSENFSSLEVCKYVPSHLLGIVSVTELPFHLYNSLTTPSCILLFANAESCFEKNSFSSIL
jgi:hypothetical protein